MTEVSSAIEDSSDFDMVVEDCECDMDAPSESDNPNFRLQIVPARSALREVRQLHAIRLYLFHIARGIRWAVLFNVVIEVF
jgi:hypothetical protein